jgi:hypothetical protein
VLTVPTSALHRSGSTYTVNVLRNGKSVATKVTIGASGTERTEIKTGLTAGTEVILADLDSTATGDSSQTTSTSGLSGLGGSSGSTTGGPQNRQFSGNPPAGAPGS